MKLERIIFSICAILLCINIWIIGLNIRNVSLLGALIITYLISNYVTRD